MKNKTNLLVVLALCTVVAVALAVYLFFFAKEPEPMEQPDIPSSSPESSEPEEASTPEPEESVPELPEGSLADWNLILLGPPEENVIEADLDIEKVQFDTQLVDSRAAPAYEAMSAAAQEAGITLYLRSGYRSMDTQRQNYNASVQRYLDAGETEANAIALTEQYITVPGHSEHHTGLAFDIITPEYHNDIYTLDDRFAETDAYEWLREHCAEYGFILRYPREKEDVTQIHFEPWHYRYVGTEHAQYIMEHGLCLEEYIELLRSTGR